MRITLDIPKQWYDEFIEIAGETNRSVEDVLMDKLKPSEPDFYVDPNHEQMQQEVDFFDTHIDELWSRYPNQFVAVKDQKVVDHDESESTLFDRIDEQYPDEVVMVRKATGQPVPILNFRSPRFVRDK